LVMESVPSYPSTLISQSPIGSGMALVLFCLMQDSRRARLFERRSQYAQRRFNSMLYLFDGYCDPNHNFSFLRSDQLQLIALKESVAQLDQCEELGGAGGEARS
jgi:hypothetical protein